MFPGVFSIICPILRSCMHNQYFRQAVFCIFEVRRCCVQGFVSHPNIRMMHIGLLRMSSRAPRGAIGVMTKSDGTPVTAVEWRGNRLVDALAKAYKARTGKEFLAPRIDMTPRFLAATR